MKKLFGIIIFTIIIIAGAVVIFNNPVKPASQKNAVSLSGKNNEERIKFIKSYGWEVSETPVEKNILLIPEVFSDTLCDYNEMQKSSGLDLEPYSGCEVVRFSYKLTNHPLDKQYARVNLFVYKDKIIAADVMSTRLDGFMHAIDKKDISEADIKE